MRTMILTAFLFATATPVLAQMPPPDARDEHRDDRGGDREHHDQGHYQGHDQRPDDRGGDRHDQGQYQRQDDRGDYRHDDRGYRQDDRGHDEHRDFGDDRRNYGDGDRYARFHGDAYFHPHGYSYRYYPVGTFLPRVYFDTRYYIGQPDYYRLPPAYAGTRWIRVGPDALLIRNYDRRVVRVIRGLFY